MLVAMLIFAYLHSVTGWHTTWVLVQEVRLIAELVRPVWLMHVIASIDVVAHRFDHLGRESGRPAHRDACRLLLVL